MPTRRSRLAVAALVLALAAACVRPAPGKLVYRISAGAAAATVEVAYDPESRARGLSGRQALGADEGMLFIFPESKPVSFWMKDTHVPLSIAFIAADGKITRITDMEPESLAPHNSVEPAFMALEMPAGWFARNSVKPGDVVTLPQEVSRLRAR